MANKVEISAVLKRNLKDGKEYDKLIPRVKCERTNLGEGDTFDTVDWMKDWIEKYSFQTAQLSTRLKGRSLEETVNNIYRFLYDHVQYTADGQLQQLRSPACTWAQRREGVDCKSYSVFASSILSNLGIKHFIRQVRQPYFYPEEFTHVYVVVPKDQNAKSYLENAPTFVLDATKHQNTESSYIEKVDLHMTKLKHIGLNAPQDERTQTIVQNFEKFCTHLLQVGIPLTTVNAIRARVNNFTSRGVDPSFKAVSEGLLVEGTLFPLRFKIDTAYQGGLGIEPVSSTMATASALLELLPTEFFNNTFGAVFSNGFDLSCWNASYSEVKAQADVSVDIPYLAGKYSGLDKQVNTTNLNKFLNGIAGYIANAVNGQKAKFAECTRKGYAEAQKAAEAARENLLQQLKSSFNLTSLGQQKGHIRTSEMPSKPGGIWEWGQNTDNAYTYEAFSISGGNSSYTPSLPTTTNTGGSTTGGDYNSYQPTGNVQTVGAGEKKSNTGLIIGGVALASVPLFFMMKKEKSTKKESK